MAGTTQLLDELVRASGLLTSEISFQKLISVLVEQSVDITASDLAALYLRSPDVAHEPLRLTYRRGRTEVPDDDFEISWHPGDVVSIAALGIALRMTPTTGQGLAAARIEDAEIVLRNRRGGESLQLPGRGHRHQVKKLFQEAGVSPLERSRLPLVYVNNELAAVGNRWIADSFAARKKEPGFVLEIHDF